MSTGNLARVERAFDEIIPGCQQQSKGILYVTTTPDDLSPLLQSSVFVLTDEQGFRLTHELKEIPQAVLIRSEDERNLLRINGAERFRDGDLKAKLTACAQLLNVQRRTFSTEKRLSLMAEVLQIPLRTPVERTTHR